MAHVSDHSISAQLIAYNAFILTKILILLPAKTLVRFKCVSKLWLSLISDSKFSKEHTHKNFTPSVKGFYIVSDHHDNIDTKFSSGLPKLDFLADIFQVKPTILHSCNGLVLCSCGPGMVVCNLTTRNLKLIPLLFRPSNITNFGSFLVFNPMRSPDFKIVLVSGPCPPFNPYGIIDASRTVLYNIDIYSSESNIWRNKQFNEVELDPLIDGVVCEGAIYWVYSVTRLLRFDIDEENLTSVQMTSDPLISSGRVKFMGEYHGHLFLALRKDTSDTEFQIVEMDLYNFRWNKKYDMNLEPVVDSFYEFWVYHHENFLCFIGGDEQETPALLLIIAEKLVLYDPMKNFPETIIGSNGTSNDFYDYTSLRAHRYIESMISI